jgi:hypothetical protein
LVAFAGASLHPFLRNNTSPPLVDITGVWICPDAVICIFEVSWAGPLSVGAMECCSGWFFYFCTVLNPWPREKFKPYKPAVSQ